MSSRNAWSDRLSPSNCRRNPNHESPLSNTSPAAAAEKSNNKDGKRRTDERRRNRRSSLRSVSCSSTGRWKYMAEDLSTEVNDREPEGRRSVKRASGPPPRVQQWSAATVRSTGLVRRHHFQVLWST